MSTFIERLGWVLVHSLWQFAVLAVIAFGLQRTMRRASSSARYLVLLGMLAVVVAAPLVTWSVLPVEAPLPVVGVAPAPMPQPPTLPREVILAPTPVAIPPALLEVASLEPVVQAPPLPSAPVPDLPQPTWSERVQGAVTPWLSTIVGGWSLGVLAFALRPLMGWFTVRRLRTTGVSPVPEAVQAALAATAQRLGITQAVRVLQSAVVQVPIVAGYFQPVILLPVSIVTGLPASQLEAILTHELAHIRRHDYLVNLVQTLVETIFFYHPAVWWLSHQIRCERENCCDDIAVTALGSRLDYSRALLALEELRATQTPLAIGANGGSLLSRVRRLFHREPEPGTLSNGSVAIGATLIVGLLALAAITTSGGGEPPKTTQKPSDPTEMLPLIAKLPGGLEVELVGVTKNFAPAKDGWKPDGTPMGEVAEWPARIIVKRNSIKSSRTDDGTSDPAARDLLVEMRGLQSQPAIALLDLQATMGMSHFPLAKPYRNRLSLLLTTPSDTLTFRMAMSDAPWGPYQQVGLDGKLLNEMDLAEPEAGHYGKIRVVRCGPHPDDPTQSELILEMPEKYQEQYDWEIHPIDTEGKEMLDLSDIGSDNSGKVTAKYRTDPGFPGKIAHWQYRLRPYRHFITFENVSIEPGKKTEPKVSVESITVADLPKPIVAKLPNGLEFELLGVTSYLGDGQDAWTPQGIKFEKAPEWAEGLKAELLPPGGNSDGVDDDFRDFIVRVRGATKDQLAMYSYSGVPARLGDGTWIGRMTVLTYNQQVQRLRIGLPGDWGPYRVLTVDPKVPPKAKAVEVPAEVLAPYRKIYDSIQPVIEEEGDLTFWLLPRLQPDGEAAPEHELTQGQYTRVVWKGQPANPDLKYTLIEAVLVDLQGKRHTTAGTTNVPDGQSQWDVDLFRVPFDQVSHVEYRLRPYQHVVTFNNVALHIGAKCGPNVVVESPLVEVGNGKAPPPLEFRLVAEAAVKEPVEFAGQKWFLITGEAASDSAGKPVVDKSALGLPVERLNEGKDYMGLVGDTPATSLLWDGTWHVEKCEVQPDPNDEQRFMIHVTLDAPGGKALRTLTTGALRQRLAVLVEDRILVAPTIQDSLGTAFVITGNFTKERAEQLAKSIRRGMAQAVGQSNSTGQPSVGSWGPAKNGVRSRLTLLDDAPHVGSAKVRVELLNEGDVAQEFAFDLRKAGKAFVIQTLDGKQVWYAMENLPVKAPHDSDNSISIPSGKSVTLLDEFDLGYAFSFEKPAEYRLRFGGDCQFPGVVSEDFPESNTLKVDLPNGPRPLIQRMGLLLKSDHHISENDGFHWGGAWAVDDHTFIFRRLDYVYVNQVSLQFTDSAEPAPLYVPEYPKGVPTPKARDVLLGKTKLGFAHLQIPELADKEWPRCEEQIRERLRKELTQVEAVSAAPRSRTVTLILQDKPLRVALAAVAEQLGLQLEIDEAALAETAFDLQRLVTTEIQDESLADAVALICDFPSAISSGACWRLRGETLVLTTMEAEMQRRTTATPEWLRPFLNKGVLPQLDDAGEVTSLYVNQEALTDELLQRLPELPHLKSMQFDPRCPATDAGLLQLRKMKALDTIELTGGRADVYRINEILGVLKTIPKLKSLSLTETGVTDSGVVHIGEMRDLDRLTIHQEGRLTDRAIDAISQLTQLKSLHLTQYVATEYFGKMAFSAESLRGLSRLKNLEHLQLTGVPVPGELIDFPQLRSLGLTGDEIDDRVAARISQCQQLTSLTLSGTRITDEGLRQIASGTRLDYFSLTNTPITDLGISHLVTLPLRHLELRGTKLTSAAFEHLAKIPTLQRIDITRAGSGMTIDGMQALKNATHLRTLWITGFPHDANYFALGELKQLRELHFEMSLTQLHELEFLEAALPNTRVSAGTGGGSVGGGIDRKARKAMLNLGNPIGDINPTVPPGPPINDSGFPKFFGERAVE